MAAFDYKKEYKKLYLPKQKPSILEVPPMRFVAVQGCGDPNEEGGAYKEAVGVLYAISYMIKISEKGGHSIDGYFSYVVPPLEGLWWMADGSTGVDYADKSCFCWISMIRLPDFVDEQTFCWAKEEVLRKKGIDTANAMFYPLDEGLCVQCMHNGSYDDEPATVAVMEAYASENGYRLDLSDARRHHEIYLSDPRRVAVEKCKTVIRHPIAKA